MPQSVTSSQRIAAESVPFEEVFEAIPDAIVILDDQGQILEMNAQTEQLFGYTRSELLGKALEILLLPDRFRQHHRRDTILSKNVKYHIESYHASRSPTTAIIPLTSCL